jgi:hypothetical protein
MREPTRRPSIGLPGWNERAAVALLVLVAGHLLAVEPTAGPLTAWPVSSPPTTSPRSWPSARRASAPRCATAPSSCAASSRRSGSGLSAFPYRRSSARLSRPLDCSGPGARSGAVCRPRSACSASFQSFAPAGGRSRTTASARGYASVTCAHSLFPPASLSTPQCTITYPASPTRPYDRARLSVGLHDHPWASYAMGGRGGLLACPVTG